MTVIPTRDRVPQLTPGGSVQRATARAGAPVHAGMTGRDVLRILRRRKWWIILPTLIAVALTAVATLVWMLNWPLYTAQALLRVEIPRETALMIQNRIQSRDIMDRLKMDHANLIKTNQVLQRTAENERVRRTSWFAKHNNPVQALYEEVGISPMPETNFIRLSMTGTERRELPEIINVLALEYAAWSAKNLSTDTGNQIKQLKRQQETLQEQLEGIRRQASGARTPEMPDIQRRYNVKDAERQDLRRRLTELEFQQVEARAALKVLDQREQEGTLAQSSEVKQMLNADGNLRSLRSERTRLHTQGENLRRKFGTQHRMVKNFSTRLATVENEIKATEETLTKSSVEDLKGYRTSEFQAITLQLLAMRVKYQAALAQARDMQTSLTRLQELAVREQGLNDQIKKIDAKLIDLQLVSRVARKVSVVSEAPIPRERSQPQWKLMIPIGVILGLGFGLGMAFLLEFLDTSIKSPSDVHRHVDLPLFGMIPYAEDLDEETEDVRLAFMEHPQSLICEAFRQIHTCLLFSGPPSQRRSLLIASASPGDGRTTVAVNLAAAAARAGRKTLVVDTNFRQPAIAELIKGPAGKGLSSILVEAADWRDLVHEIEPNLHVIPAGMLPPNPAELLGSEQMRQFINEAAEDYDQVLYDSAPCMVVTDALPLSTMVDGVVIVIRAGANTYGIVQRTREVFVRVGAHVLAGVLNAVRVTPGGYLRKNYDTFYEYQEQAQLPA